MSGLGGAAGGMPGTAAGGLVMPPLTREKQAPLQKAAAATQGGKKGQAQLTGGDAEQQCKCHCGQNTCAAKPHRHSPTTAGYVAGFARCGCRFRALCSHTHRATQQGHKTGQQRLTH